MLISRWDKGSHRIRRESAMFATTYKYFKFGPTSQITIEAIKRQYRELAMRWHPDRPNGNLEAMQTINAEFDQLRKRYYNVHESQSGATYTDEAQDTYDTVTANFVEIIDRLVHMDGVGIEICGTFLWLDGNTYAHKTEIKGLGFRWASKKRRWFLAPEGWRKKGHRELTMGEIRSNYGSKRVAEGYGRKALEA